MLLLSFLMLLSFLKSSDDLNFSLKGDVYDSYAAHGYQTQSKFDGCNLFRLYLCLRFKK